MDIYKLAFEDVKQLTEELDFSSGTNDEIIDFYMKLHHLVRLSGLLVIEEPIKAIPVPLVRNILGEVCTGVEPMEIIEHANIHISGLDTTGSDGLPAIRGHLHVLGALLVQNGDGRLQTKMNGFIRDFDSPDLSTDAAAMIRAIRRAHGDLFFPEEEEAHACLLGNYKDHQKAKDLYSCYPVEDLQGRSLFDLALIHYSDDPISQESLNLALSYAVRAAEYDHVPAAFTAAHHLIEGVPSFSDDLNGWLEYPDERSVILGFTPYPDTIKTTPDIEKGMSILLEAAKTDHSASAYDLSVQLARAGDMKNAYHWLVEAAVNASTIASDVLGDFYSGRNIESPFDRLKESGIGSSRHEAIETYAFWADHYPPILPKMIETIFESKNPMAYEDRLKMAYTMKPRPTWGKEHLLEFLGAEYPVDLKVEDILGIAYFGDIMNRDLEKARGLLDAAYNEGRKSGYTVYLLGILQLPGWKDSPEDAVTAHKLFMEAADLGCAPAAAIAGLSCRTGGRAFFPPELTADSSAAQIEEAFYSPTTDEALGLKDTVAAERYLRQAADAGFAYACLVLSELYGDEGKDELAWSYRVRAAHLGEYTAILAVAASYCGLDGTEKKDFVSAERYCELADLQSSRREAHDKLLSHIESIESHEVPQEFINRLLTRAAENGSKMAAIRLGLGYLEGTTAPPDIQKGVEWLLAVDGPDYDEGHVLVDDLEARRAEALAELYGNRDMAIYDADEAQRFVRLARDVRAEKDQMQSDMDALFGV